MDPLLPGTSVSFMQNAGKPGFEHATLARFRYPKPDSGYHGGRLFDRIVYPDQWLAHALGILRQPIHLNGYLDAPGAVGVKDPGLDMTKQLSVSVHETTIQLQDDTH